MVQVFSTNSNKLQTSMSKSWKRVHTDKVRKSYRTINSCRSCSSREALGIVVELMVSNREVSHLKCYHFILVAMAVAVAGCGNLLNDTNLLVMVAWLIGFWNGYKHDSNWEMTVDQNSLNFLLMLFYFTEGLTPVVLVHASLCPGMVTH